MGVKTSKMNVFNKRPPWRCSRKGKHTCSNCGCVFSCANPNKSACSCLFDVCVVNYDMSMSYFCTKYCYRQIAEQLIIQHI